MENLVSHFCCSAQCVFVCVQSIFIVHINTDMAALENTRCDSKVVFGFTYSHYGVSLECHIVSHLKTRLLEWIAIVDGWKYHLFFITSVYFNACTMTYACKSLTFLSTDRFIIIWSIIYSIFFWKLGINQKNIFWSAILSW